MVPTAGGRNLTWTAFGVSVSGVMNKPGYCCALYTPQAKVGYSVQRVAVR